MKFSEILMLFSCFSSDFCCQAGIGAPRAGHHNGALIPSVPEAILANVTSAVQRHSKEGSGGQTEASGRARSKARRTSAAPPEKSSELQLITHIAIFLMYVYIVKVSSCLHIDGYPSQVLEVLLGQHSTETGEEDLVKLERKLEWSYPE